MDYDRLEAFLPRTLALSAFGNLQHKSAEGLAVRVRAGSVFWVPADEESGPDDSEIVLGYGAQSWYEQANWRAGVAFTGRWILTEEEADFGEASVHQLTIFGDAGFGQVRPGIYLRLPVDEDLSDITNTVVGLSLSVRVR